MLSPSSLIELSFFLLHAIIIGVIILIFETSEHVFILKVTPGNFAQVLIVHAHIAGKFVLINSIKNISLI